MRYLVLLLLMITEISLSQVDNKTTVQDSSFIKINKLLDGNKISFPSEPIDTTDFNKYEFKNDWVIYIITLFYHDRNMTASNIKDVIYSLGMSKPKDVFIHLSRESGNFKSALAINANNLSGMQRATKRRTMALDITYKGYAKYSHWVFSIIDYWIWQSKSKPLVNEKYRDYLVRRGYFPSHSR